MQDLPENQDPSVAYITDEVTKAVWPFEPADFREKGTETPKPKKRAARKPKEPADLVTPGADQDDEADPGDDDELEPVKAAADPTSLREVGS